MFFLILWRNKSLAIFNYRPQTKFEARLYFHRCLSVHNGSLPTRGGGGRYVYEGEGLGRHSLEPEKRAVRILLEYFLVD